MFFYVLQIRLSPEFLLRWIIVVVEFFRDIKEVRLIDSHVELPGFTFRKKHAISPIYEVHLIQKELHMAGAQREAVRKFIDRTAPYRF